MSFGILTTTGRNKEAAAIANGKAFTITEMAWGDGTRIPSGGETALENEQGRKPVNGSGVIAEQPNTAFFSILLKTQEGPFVVREVGLYDADGDMVAIAHFDPPVNKPLNHVQAIVQANILFSDLENLVLTVQSAGAYVPVERKFNAGDGLTGGGDLSADQTLAVDFATVAEARAGLEPTKVISPATLKTRIDDLLGSAPAALDTLNELAEALGDDPNFAATILNRLNNPVTGVSAGGGLHAVSHRVWANVPNGRLTVPETGKYQVTGTFRLLAGGPNIHLQFWQAAITHNDARVRYIFGLNADETGQSNNDTTVTSTVFLDLAKDDVLSHSFSAELSQNTTIQYEVTYDILKIGAAP
ncbi:phage tail protein [Ruegeria halocynthiae]|uniref:phage tail-collar fiber domain-containing protein n=1 Tax=Ruegeria halocynthiae TaxID=985054 RepID=UPI00055E4C3B|nr:phage tail protein [Ruegeria halocynthiae]